MPAPEKIFFEITMNTNHPEIRKELADIGRMPRDAERLRIEAALCQWWANRCLEQAGAMDALTRRDKNTQDRARATRQRNREEKNRASTTPE